MSSRFFPRFAALGFTIVLLVGCSDHGLKTIPVYGTVTFADRERPKGCRIFFKPVKVEGISRPAAAEATSGSYTANAFSTSKGLIPGTYRIEVSYYDLKAGKNPNLESSYAETNYDAGEVIVDSNSSGVEHNIEVPKKG
jgi:hypothetical protein